MRISVPPQDAQPFDTLSADQQEIVRSTVMAHVREALRRGPHSVFELLAGLKPAEAGAFSHTLQLLVDAGEIVSMGHAVYAAVPWMPAARRVETDPVQDLVLSAIALIKGPTAERISQSLALSLRQVGAALRLAESTGIIVFNPSNGQYRFAAAQVSRLYRNGAAGRVFAPVAENGV
ncbi:hypothetical protein HLH33_17780 [Gluconacetobacter diazotrophicus]|uniref:Uncharacterized protein n=1 Tax=Gluconacetobacter diazotrophicus TaxID=33996 RepID=A0A7W4I8B9_GLUDI|nr:hypothetical protein [Gluconacetobacter diazotrophicus]MBB2158123.1 hypothetical protein [Gluconacetobacter diazotrophicus]